MLKFRSAVFISSGLGNAITLVPLINALKSKGHHVTGIFTSEFNCQELFHYSDIFDEKLTVRSKTSFILKSISKRKKFDYLFADRFSCTRKHFWLAESIADKIFIQHDIGDSPETFIYKAPSAMLHSIHNNLKLAEDIIGTKVKPDLTFINVDRKKDAPIIFQPASGNNNTPWKVWPIEHWIEILKRINHPIVVIGDKNELALGKQLKDAGIKNIDNKIGKTTIRKMVQIVASGSIYIGHDSGPMHIAAAAGVPTFTLWGGSNLTLFGYEKLYPESHKTIQLSVSCNPCDSWLKRNTTRVSDPYDCPDFKCIREIQTEYVAEELTKFANHLGIKIHFE